MMSICHDNRAHIAVRHIGRRVHVDKPVAVLNAPHGMLPTFSDAPFVWFRRTMVAADPPRPSRIRCCAHLPRSTVSIRGGGRLDNDDTAAERPIHTMNDCRT